MLEAGVQSCVNEYMYTLIHVYIFTDNACSMNIERTNNFFFIITGCLLVMSRHLCFYGDNASINQSQVLQKIIKGEKSLLNSLGIIYCEERNLEI